MQRYVDEDKLPGVVTLVARRGKVVHFEAVGRRDVERDEPMTKDTLFRLYSQTKPVTGVAVMLLYEEGRILLKDAIADYLPEFADMQVYVGEEDGRITTEAAGTITIQHLLTHTSGLTYSFFPTPVGRMYAEAGIREAESPQGSLAEWAHELAKLPLIAQPGTDWNYSVGMDLAGRLVEVVSGKSLRGFLRERIFEPLAMHDTERARRQSAALRRELRPHTRWQDDFA
jgi:CubicO group peptidase (beta-lactamase class C family)